MLCAVILSLCLVGTIADALLSFTRSSTPLVDKSNEYLPVTNDSMEIDDTQEANAPNFFGSDKQNGPRRTRDQPETTSLISRSPPVEHFQPRGRRKLRDVEIWTDNDFLTYKHSILPQRKHCKPKMPAF